MACRIEGVPHKFINPKKPRKLNHISIIGPNILPTTAVPNRWIENRRASIIKVIKITGIWREPNVVSNAGIVLNPSIAEVTVTAGVSAPSESRAAPPIIAGIINHLAYLRTNVKSEKIPPSWLLSALRAINTYFTVVIKVRVHMINEIEPMIDAFSICSIPPCDSRIDCIV